MVHMRHRERILQEELQELMFSEARSCKSDLSCSVKELRDGEGGCSNKEQKAIFVLISDDEEVAC